MRLIAILLMACVVGGHTANAENVNFSSVPVNIIDAPVLEYRWHQVTRTNNEYYTTWRATFGFASAGIVIVAQINPGHNWIGSAFGSRNWVLGQFEDDGFGNFGRVESLDYAGRYWGYIATANLSRLKCVIGLSLKREHNSADVGEEGGSLYAQVFDCSSDAQERYSAWKRWFHSFKEVGNSYNEPLDHR